MKRGIDHPHSTQNSNLRFEHMDHSQWVENVLEIRNRLAQAPEEGRKKFLAELPEEFRKKLLSSPYVLGRDKQVEALTSDADTVLVICGRGWGKNWLGSHWILDRIQRGRVAAAAVADTASDVRDDMVDPATPGDGILDIGRSKNLKPNYKSSKRRVLIHPEHGQKSRIQTYSAEEPDALRGFSGSAAWLDEFAKYSYPERVWNQINFTLRGGDSQLLITTTPRPLPIVRKLIESDNVHVIRGSSFENSAHLDERFQRKLSELKGTRLGRQEIHAEILEDAGDLWSYEDIAHVTKDQVPDLVRIVVGLDPSISDGEGDEAGIVVVGKDDSGTAYVLEDFSGQMTTARWGQVVVAAYHGDNHNWPPADRIHAERNQGGSLVESQIRTVDPRVAYNSTHTTHSKQVRAEPVHTLYEQGRVKHVGQHAELEDQMTDFLQGEDSPDRVDALVYAITELLLEDNLSPVRSQHIIGLD